MGFAGRRCMRWRGFAGRRGLCETWRQGFAEHGCEAVWGAAVGRSFAGRDGAACGGSGAMGYSVRARASSLHFFTFMGLIFVKYWVIMQM